MIKNQTDSDYFFLPLIIGCAKICIRITAVAV